MEKDVSAQVETPFWKDLPLCEIHRAITPDILHQLYQGVFKHLISWCLKISPTVLDQRIAMLPPSFGVCHFKSGFSILSQITGTERKNMAKVLLGCLVSIIPRDGLAAITGLLDFIQLAQYESHNKDTLQYMEDALQKFHDNKDYFIRLGCREHFNIPKFHSLLHYVESIKTFGTTDNYNTEMFECLHIDYAKNGWRASNKRNAFPQMIQYLTRQEVVAYLAAIQAQESKEQTDSDDVIQPGNDKDLLKSRISVSKHPAYPSSSISTVADLHCAPDFGHTLKVYINSCSPPSQRIPVKDLDKFALPIESIDVYRLFRFHPTALHDRETDKEIVKALRKSPLVIDKPQSLGLAMPELINVHCQRSKIITHIVLLWCAHQIINRDQIIH
ncbi:hypothetical protein BJ165DRAFT_1357787 [Panaeolus papilionaceus]|nr:hypothetical protein BJ165DRAFT_1357787 [Panaeolus papilionaceus]